MRWTQIRRLLRYRQVWGASIGQFGGNSTLVFFLGNNHALSTF
jgi:ACS family D-galactonate transporter-like MFS transporter